VDPFDAGQTIDLQGPGKALSAESRTVPGVYLNVLEAKEPQAPAFFGAGTWTVRVPGGRTVMPFSTTRTLPPPLRWLNRESAAQIDRGRDLPIRWAADGYTSQDVMTVTLSSAAANLGARAGAVRCRAPALAGEVIFPAGLMASISRIPIGVLELRLAPRADGRARFEMPLADGGIERGVFEYLFTETLRVDIR
jgi:hypothetical protein